MQHPDANIDFVEVKDVQGETALMIAVKLNKLELIKILTNAFSNLSGINIMEHVSILHIAISNNRPDILRHLINSTSSTSLDYLDNEFRTPIMYAAELDHAKCLQELIEYGADFHTKNLNSGETLMHIVAKNHSNSTLPFLMNITHISWFFIQKDYEGNTPYMTAIKSGNDKFLQESFKVKTVDLSECNAEGETSTYYTVKQGFPSVLLTLLLSPKYYQFAKSKPAELVSDKAEILKAEIRGDLYATDVYILLKKVIRYPLVPYFPPNLLAKTKENQTVFHACALGGSLECLEFLYEFYRLFAPKYFLDEFDEPGLRGDTPLLIAAQCGLASASCVFFFVSHGADLSATNNEGLSVVQAIFAYNPDATHLFISLFNSCVTAKKEHYYSEKMNIRIDFSTLCPKAGNQMNVVSLLFKESKEIDRRKILTHPVIVAFLQKKIHNLKSVLYIRFIVSIIITVTVSVLIPLLYIVAGDPKDNYGLPLFYVMKTVFIFMVAFCVFHVLLKIPAVMTRNMWFTDAVAFVPPTSMITLIACGKSYYIAPELSAMTILSCWMCVLVFSINIYSTFSYQSAVFFRLLNSISKQILVLTVIMFAFALSFFCLYNDDKRFAHFPTSFIYTFTVLLPGYLSDLPTFKKEYFSKTSSFHFLIECLVLSSFIVMASTGFVNMLVGLAVRGGRHLELEGKIFQNHHQTHYMCEIEYWFRNHIFKWLMKKKMFSFLKECRRRITIDLVLDIYAEENKEICDDTMVRQFRSIVFKRYKVEKETEGEHVATENLEDVFNEPFGHLPGAKGSASTLDHKPTRYPTHPETSFTNLLD